MKLLDLYNSLSDFLLQNLLVIALDLQDLQSLTTSQSILNMPRDFLFISGLVRGRLRDFDRLLLRIWTVSFAVTWGSLSICDLFERPTRLRTLSIAADKSLLKCHRTWGWTRNPSGALSWLLFRFRGLKPFDSLRIVFIYYYLPTTSNILLFNIIIYKS